MKLDYFGRNESEQFSFFRIPKILIKDKKYKALSDAARILYGLLLDRMSLSNENGWIDDNNHVYIIYTIKQIQEALNWGRDKAINALAELDTNKGIGLIERIKRGQGNPDIIYVLKFIEHKEEVLSKDEKTNEFQEDGKSDFKKSKNATPRSRKTQLQEVGKCDSKKSKNATPRSRKMRLQEVEVTDLNYTENNNTELNNHHQSYLEYNTEKNDEIDVGLTQMMLREYVMYDSLIESYPDEIEYIDEIIDVMTDVTISSASTIKIAGDNKNASIVKSVFAKVDYYTVEYVLDSLRNNKCAIKNIKNYLMTTIYNATMTRNHYFRSLANAN